MPGPFEIRADDLSGPAVARLLQEHLEFAALHSPPESVHALDLEALRAPEVTFWTIWQGSELVGCGALKELDASHGEVKSMRTSKVHLGKGVASAILSHLIEESKRRTYLLLSLETGTGPAFFPAHSLYEKFGFRGCGPFGDYAENQFSRFMALQLQSATSA